LSIRRFLRFFLWSVIVFVALGGALFGYFVYSAAREVPRLSGTLTRGSIEVDGLMRTYRTYVPQGLAKGAPVVVVMHGSGENGSRIRIETGYGFDRTADTHGFAVVYPDAYEGDWEACSIVGSLSTKGLAIDDVGFLARLVDKLIREIGVDPGRVFAAGSSRGGSMAIRLALEGASRFRAVAAVSANVPAPENFRCKPAGRSASIMIMNGTEDPLMPFDGGEVSLFGLFYKNGRVRSSRESGQYFADLNHIAGAPATHETNVADGVRVEQVLWRNDLEVEVELVAIHGGGHGIPQPYRRRPPLVGPLLQGPSLREPNGPDMIWAFFERQRP
jgi:polyhydroxybutyrate depolymerase